MAARHRHNSRRRGFTLVEVLAALMLVAIILPVAMRGVSLAVGTAGHAKRQVEAAGLAENKLAELVITQDWQDADLSGDFGDDFPEYTWSGEVTEWQEASLSELSIEVHWTGTGRERSVTLTTLVYAGSQ